MKMKEKQRQADAVLAHRNFSVAKIQAMVRGVQCRVRFAKNLPALKKALTAKGFCVECENKVARRRCRQCRDNFCEACYDKLHKKGKSKVSLQKKIYIYIPIKFIQFCSGKRKDHNWVSVTGREGRSSGGNRTLDSAGAGAGVVKGPKWEEFWDESAKANYWFNVDTGEATWIKPAGFVG